MAGPNQTARYAEIFKSRTLPEGNQSVLFKTRDSCYDFPKYFFPMKHTYEEINRDVPGSSSSFYRPP
jgi:hypothetical protein